MFPREIYICVCHQNKKKIRAHPGTGDWIQPLVAAINCTLWVLYGLFKEHRDIPVALANAPGIFFGLAAAITALM